MVKTILAILILGFVGCGGNDSGPGTTKQQLTACKLSEASCLDALNECTVQKNIIGSNIGD